MTTRPPDQTPDSGDRPSSLFRRQHDQSPPANWGRRTGPLSRPLNSQEMPDLGRFSDTPRYDLATFVELISVRAVTLRSWEQNLGLFPHGNEQERSTTGPCYSERHLVALTWLRNQIITGADPTITAKRLREALAALRGGPATPAYTPTTQGTPASGNTPIGNGPLTPSFTPTSGIRGGTSQLGGNPGTPFNLPVIGSSSRPAGTDIRTIDTEIQPIIRTNSRPLMPQQPQTGSAYPTTARTHSRPLNDVSQTGTPSADARNILNPYFPKLMQAFAFLDTVTVTRHLDDVLMMQSIESVCQTLITPLLNRIDEIWVRKDTVQTEALFAITMLKARLFRIFDMVPEAVDAPVIFLACGPDEPHEIDALMAAVIWRRAGLRVVYFGQHVDGTMLTEAVTRHKPRVVVISLSSLNQIKLITRCIRDIEQNPAVAMCLIGSALNRNPEQHQRIGGIFLGTDPVQAIQHIQQLARPREMNG